MRYESQRPESRHGARDSTDEIRSWLFKDVPATDGNPSNVDGRFGRGITGKKERNKGKGSTFSSKNSFRYLMDHAAYVR